MTVLQEIEACRIVSILRGIPQEKTLGVVQALLKGGVHVVEITFDQKRPDSWLETAKGIGTIRDTYDGRILVGAGTIMNKEQAALCADAGAVFALAPDMNLAVMEEIRKRGLVCIPGAMTPSEISEAYRNGADIVKVFPAGRLGAKYIADIRGPISHIPLMAVGGIGADNIREYLDAGCIGAGIGSNLVNAHLAMEDDYGEITKRAEELCQAVGGM